MRSKLLIGLAVVVIAIPLLSQTLAPVKPSFEVVSIKPSAPGGVRLTGPRGDRYRVLGGRLRVLLTQAYQKVVNGLPAGQLEIIGGPSWIDADRYDIEATADCSRGALPPEQLQLMIRSMLEDRFQLKAHMETRDLPIYNLVVAKDGPKLTRAEDQTPLALPSPAQACSPVNATPGPPPTPPAASGSLPRGRLATIPNPNGFILMQGVVPVTNLASALEVQLGQPVVDKTGIKGLYDFKFTFSSVGLKGPQSTPLGTAPPADPAPSIFSAMQELGLRLESVKGPVGVLVVDSVQKPTIN